MHLDGQGGCCGAEALGASRLQSSDCIGQERRGAACGNGLGPQDGREGAKALERPASREEALRERFRGREERRPGLEWLRVGRLSPFVRPVS